MLKVPTALRQRNYGGADVGRKVRKENFLYVAPRFIRDVADRLQIAGEIHKDPGPNSESGVVELVHSDAVLRLHEDPSSRAGLILEFIPVDGSQLPVCELAKVVKDHEVEDWIYKVKSDRNRDRADLN